MLTHLVALLCSPLTSEGNIWLFSKVNAKHVRVKDNWSKARHPNQNPVEQGGVRILKAGVDGILDQTGAPAGTWPYAYSYIADINNHCASRFLG